MVNITYLSRMVMATVMMALNGSNEVNMVCTVHSEDI